MDWVQLMEDNSIDYVTRGPNTKRGEISIRCPWCGEDDPSHHLGISLTTENWGCHRNTKHRGHAPGYLISALLNCSMAQAKLVVAQYDAADPETLDDAVALMTATSEPRKVKAGPLALPPDFRLIKRHDGRRRYWHYLAERGFDDVDALVENYTLMCAMSGYWKDRIIIPFWHNEKLIGWTGRALGTPINAPRYLSSSDAVKTTIFNYDELRQGGDTLVVTEGPFDAIKFDYYARGQGVRATCVFGVTMTVDQIVILNSMRRRFARVVILFDDDAVEPSMGAKDWIMGDNVYVERLPNGAGDPGAMSGLAVRKLATQLKKL